MDSSIILGISAFYHDSAAAIVKDGKIIAAAQEERFTRKKHDPAFPIEAIRYCLKEAGCTIDEVDDVVFYDKPFIKFERLLETYYAFAPVGVSSFIRSMPVWMGEKLFTKKKIKDGLKEVMPYRKKDLNILFTEHHLSHAASAYYPSPFEDSAILTIDGVGEWATVSMCHGKGKDIEVLKELHFPHSLGLLYSAFTYYLGFRVNSGEYKLMGLAPYGNRNSERTRKYVESIKKEMIRIYDDGSLWLNQKYFKYATGLRMTRSSRWESLLGIARREGESQLEQEHCDLAAAIQIITEEVVLLMVKHIAEISGSKNLCLAGGVALNCVANGKILNEGTFDNVYIQPAAGDAGGALGAALSAHFTKTESERQGIAPDAMEGSYLGPEFHDIDIERTLKFLNAKARHFSSAGMLENTAAHIEQGKVVGWFQGRMEFGPRALGGRSILGDPRSEEMQKTINLKIKYRESFRPFAPSIKAENVSEYFDFEGTSPYMLLVDAVHPDHILQLPEDYDELDLKSKLYVNRSTLPAITHVDLSARIQTVHPETNPLYHGLLSEFESLTGCPVLINTSFNVRGEPIVCTPEDAYRCFMRTEMDVLVLGNYILHKEDQPHFDDKDKWQEEYVLD